MLAVEKMRQDREQAEAGRQRQQSQALLLERATDIFPLTVPSAGGVKCNYGWPTREDVGKEVGPSFGQCRPFVC